MPLMAAAAAAPSSHFCENLYSKNGFSPCSHCKIANAREVEAGTFIKLIVFGAILQLERNMAK
jgi:hypothetical protein